MSPPIETGRATSALGTFPIHFPGLALLERWENDIRSGLPSWLRKPTSEGLQELAEQVTACKEHITAYSTLGVRASPEARASLEHSQRLQNAYDRAADSLRKVSDVAAGLHNESRKVQAACKQLVEEIGRSWDQVEAVAKLHQQAVATLSPAAMLQEVSRTEHQTGPEVPRIIDPTAFEEGLTNKAVRASSRAGSESGDSYVEDSSRPGSAHSFQKVAFVQAHEVDIPPRGPRRDTFGNVIEPGSPQRYGESGRKPLQRPGSQRKDAETGEHSSRERSPRTPGGHT